MKFSPSSSLVSDSTCVVANLKRSIQDTPNAKWRVLSWRSRFIFKFLNGKQNLVVIHVATH